MVARSAVTVVGWEKSRLKVFRKLMELLVRSMTLQFNKLSVLPDILRYPSELPPTSVDYLLSEWGKVYRFRR